MTGETSGGAVGPRPAAERETINQVEDLEFASSRRELTGWQRSLFRTGAIAFVAWHLWILLVSPVDPAIHRTVHVYGGAILGLALFAPSLRGRLDSVPWYDWALMACCIGIIAHFVLDAEGIEMRTFMGPSTRDIIVSGLMIIILLEFTRRTAGVVMPIIALVFLAYPFVGPWMPGVLNHKGFAFDETLIFISTTEGILGTTTQVSATFIIIFVAFASFLQVSRIGDYFNDLALWAVGWARGGPAKVTVLSGALFGTISGSAVANVVASGTFTIPMMRRVGYDRETAAAVEATSSTGGQITPPVMGAGAFIMAEVLGMPYGEIALAGVIPAFLFYVANYAHCDLHARKAGLAGLRRSELPPFTAILGGLYKFAPLVLLVWTIMNGFSPFRAAALGMAATLAIMAGTILVHRLVVAREGILRGPIGAVRELLAAIADALAGSSRECSQLIAVCAAAGIVAGVINLTGVGGRFASMLLAIAGDSGFLAMLFAMVVAMILGMGVPTTAAYAIAAAVVAPGLIRVGTPPLVAHMFIFYFATLSAITPPVALASFAAAGMAGGNMWKTSLIAIKLGLATFIVPFMFWISPTLLAQGPLGPILISVASATLGVVALAIATEGWLMGSLALPLRIVTAGAALLLMIPETMTDLLGLGLLSAVAAWQWMAARRRDAAA
jgi:TRAP transporter 4TM/12TM fusion protein